MRPKYVDELIYDSGQARLTISEINMTLEESRLLGFGYLLTVGEDTRGQHYWGGENHLKGGECPNCQKPLFRHMTIDCTDSRLQSQLENLACSQLPLLYCMRCELCFSDFSYRLIDDAEVEIVVSRDGGNCPDWGRLMGCDEFPFRHAMLTAVPKRLDELWQRLHLGRLLNASEMREVGVLTNRYRLFDNQTVGALMPVSVLGGLPYLLEMEEGDTCSYCEMLGIPHFPLSLLAVISNAPNEGLLVTVDDWYQILFFICFQCGTIKVRNRV